MIVLGIDAAWTSTQPTGVALVRRRNGAWETLGVAPSYTSFISCASKSDVAWATGRFVGTRPDMRSLLISAESIGGASVDVVAIDMPIASVPFCGRRAADNAISKTFGQYGCSAHSPTDARPGRLGEDLSNELRNLGYPVATADEPAGTPKRTIEVYPHPALLSLLNESFRVRYKVAKSRRYWPDASVSNRIASLLVQFKRIHAALSSKLGDPGFHLPTSEAVNTLSGLKRYEDALDALISAWVGVEYVNGQAIPYGDDTAAVWVPPMGNGQHTDRRLGARENVSR